MTRKTSFDEIYTTIGPIIKRVTGRDWWKKKGIQARPNTPYALISIQQGVSLQNQVVESIEIDPPSGTGEVFRQTPWNATTLECRVEFFKDGINDAAYDAATRFRSALYLEERFFDLWEICGLVDNVTIIDISTLFRADTEPRAEVRFTLTANIADPAPLDDTDIYDIQSQEINVTHNSIDNIETEIIVDVDSPYKTIDDSSTS